MGSLELMAEMPQDMTKDEKEVVRNFIANGCPELLRVQQSDIFKWFDLYMSGKTYAEIATITRSKKDLIMYIAYKSTWMDKRLKHYEDISLNILEKIKKSKLDSANNLITIISSLGKYCEQRYNKFLTTNDPDTIEGIDTKIVTQYFKAMELLEKLINPEGEGDGNRKTSPQVPLVNINMGSSATVKQTDPQTLEITDETAGDLLKTLASLKKAHEDKR
jgi:hypothetical protein